MADQFLFIGDSLIEFFNWQERFPDRKIFNYGVAGETAEGLFARLPYIVMNIESPGLVMIMTGINNVAMEDYGFLFTYEKIIGFLQETYEKPVIFMTSLLPVDLFFLGDAIPRVNRRLRDIAAKTNVHYHDLYPLFIDDDSRIITSYFEPDGVHLSGEGYEVWSRAIEKNILPVLGEENS